LQSTSDVSNRSEQSQVNQRVYARNNVNSGQLIRESEKYEYSESLGDLTISHFYVSKEGDDNRQGLSPGSAFGSIQYAVDNAPDGSTIHIGEGRFLEDIIIEGKKLTLVGERDNTFIVKTHPEDPVVSIKNADVTLNDFNVSGREDQPSSVAKRGIYIENSNVHFENINLYFITYNYVTIIDSNANINNVSLRMTDTRPYLFGADIGIKVAGNSDVTINQLVADENHIDHVIDSEEFVSRYVEGRWQTVTVPNMSNLTVTNSVIGGRGYLNNWGDGIKFYGSGENQLVIMNNHFIGYPDEPFPQFVSDIDNEDRNRRMSVRPNAISLSDANAEISGNLIQNFSTGIYVQPGADILAFNNQFSGNGFGVITAYNPEIQIYDFGGGPLGSSGGNIFTDNHVMDVYHRGPNNQFYAGNNFWGTSNREEIERRIFHQSDDLDFGPVIYEPFRQ